MTAKKRRTVFFGVWLLPEDYNCVRIQALLQGTSRGSLVRYIIRKYIVDNLWTEENLAKRYADHLHADWRLRLKDTTTFDRFLKDVEENLVKETLPPYLIKAILERCREKKLLR